MFFHCPAALQAAPWPAGSLPGIAPRAKLKIHGNPCFFNGFLGAPPWAPGGAGAAPGPAKALWQPKNADCRINLFIRQSPFSSGQGSLPRWLKIIILARFYKGFREMFLTCMHTTHQSAGIK